MKSKAKLMLLLSLTLLFCLGVFVSATTLAAGQGGREREKCRRRCDERYNRRIRECRDVRGRERRACEERAEKERRECVRDCRE